MNKARLILALPFLILIGLLIYFETLTPSLQRNWSLDQAVLPEIQEVGPGEYEIKNIRNFTYASTTSYTPSYYNRKIKVSDVDSVDYIVEPFGDLGAAHTFVSFGFRDGSYLAFSIEIRKEIGESFSPWKGILRQYELMYVVADERDVINLRANHRKHKVYLYPTTATKAEAQALFLSFVNHAKKVHTSPEFYNTITNNCTTNIIDRINELREDKISWDHRMLMPEYSAELAQELGLIAVGFDLELVREKYLINELAAKYQGEEDFSKLIRTKLVDDRSFENEREVAKVLRVIDGDTIEVLFSGQEKRVRLIGVDAPEEEKEGKEAECFATESTTWLTNKLGGQEVWLEKDVSEVDKYGRLLRYVYQGEENINQSILAVGAAKAVVYPPDEKFATEFGLIEHKAQSEGRGLWGQCN